MKIVCYGDSNTYGYDPRSILGEPYDPENRWVDILAERTGWNVFNQGICGQEIPQIQTAFPVDTDILIIMLGTNDLLQSRSPESAGRNMQKFLESVELDRNKILLIAPPPMKLGAWVQDLKLISDSIALAKLYQMLALRLGIRFANAGKWNVSLSYDGVHFTEEGHIAFAEGLINYLNKGV